MCHIDCGLQSAFPCICDIGDEIAALRYSDIDAQVGELTISHVMMDAKHMPGMIVPCEERTVLYPVVSNM